MNDRECDCPPEWLPPTTRCPERMVSCAHFEGHVLRLFRHADLPNVLCLLRDTAWHPHVFVQGIDDALAAFHEAEARLLGRAE